MQDKEKKAKDKKEILESIEEVEKDLQKENLKKKDMEEQNTESIDSDEVEYEEVKEEKKNQLQKSEDTEITKLDNFNSVQEMLDFAKVLISSKLVPESIRSPEKLVAVIQQGRELGIPAVAAMNNIHNIQGRATLGVHAYTALARKHHIDWEILKDCLYVYEDGHEDKNVNPVLIKEHGKPIDKICEIKFYRYNEKLDRVMENVLSFSKKEAEKQGLMDRHQWQNMINIMLRTRTLVIGIRFVASDVFMGIYETSEVLDIKRKNYDVDEEGQVINI